MKTIQYITFVYHYKFSIQKKESFACEDLTTAFKKAELEIFAFQQGSTENISCMQQFENLNSVTYGQQTALNFWNDEMFRMRMNHILIETMDVEIKEIPLWSPVVSAPTPTVPQFQASNGATCRQCRNYNNYAQPMFPDGTYTCYSCRVP